MFKTHMNRDEALRKSTGGWKVSDQQFPGVQISQEVYELALRSSSMTSSMIDCVQPVSEEDSDIDRISSLPKDVINKILGCLPTQDAARTCVLSSMWRCVWSDHPDLVVDKEFWDTIKQKKLSKEFPVDFAVDTLNRMLIHHSGPIVGFVVDISVVRSERHCDVDLWLSFLSKRSLKALDLENSSATPYAIPSCVFSNPDLTYLSLTNCILKTSKSFTALHKLKHLNLENLTLPSWVLVMPLLSHLRLADCRGIHDFIISAPQLEALIYCNDDLNLVPYLVCSHLKYACIMKKEIEHQQDAESINMMKLRSCWPMLSTFTLDELSLKYLTMGIDPKEFAPMLSLRSFVVSSIDVDQIPWVLRILQNSPLLRTFEIWFSEDVDSDLEVANYLEEQNIMNQRMDELRVGKMKYFSSSKAKLLFMKILLCSSPSLERMLVEEDESLDLIERLKISKELMQLPRASPCAEIIFAPNLLPD